MPCKRHILKFSYLHIYLFLFSLHFLNLFFSFFLSFSVVLFFWTFSYFVGYCYWLKKNMGILLPNLLKNKENCSKSGPGQNFLCDVITVPSWSIFSWTNSSDWLPTRLRWCNLAIRLITRKPYVVAFFFKIPLLTEKYFN